MLRVRCFGRQNTKQLVLFPFMICMYCTDIPIKLVNDVNDPAGRVEFYHNGNYHTICGRGFDRADLMVVCRMLGFDNIP